MAFQQQMFCGFFKVFFTNKWFGTIAANKFTRLVSFIIEHLQLSILCDIINTGPGLPLLAMKKAFANTDGISLASVIW
jgi:hypothetical protein